MTAPLEIVHVAPDSLKPAAYNPRTMTTEARTRLMNGIRAFGLVDPIIVRAEDRMVIGGHQRLAVALELGLAEVPVVMLSDLDDQQAAALNVLLNNQNAAGDWDYAKLTELLSTLDGDGFDTTLTGFSEDEIEKLVNPSGWSNPGESAPDIGPQFGVFIDCGNEVAQQELFNRLTAEGLTCKLIT